MSDDVAGALAAQEVFELLADHPMWEGIDYSAEREARIAEFIDGVRAMLTRLLGTARAQGAEQALRDAASSVYEEWPGGTGLASLEIMWAEDWLTERADRLAADHTPET